MPSRELFKQQNPAYHDTTLPPDVAARVAVEEGSVVGWDRHVGWTGAMTGTRTFGSSAQIKDLLKKFSSTPKKTLAAAKEQIAKTRRQTA